MIRPGGRALIKEGEFLHRNDGVSRDIVTATLQPTPMLRPADGAARLRCAANDARHGRAADGTFRFLCPWGPAVCHRVVTVVCRLRRSPAGDWSLMKCGRSRFDKPFFLSPVRPMRTAWLPSC